MKKFLQTLTHFFNSIADARTAAAMARLGHHEAAVKKIQSR